MSNTISGLTTELTELVTNLYFMVDDGNDLNVSKKIQSDAIINAIANALPPNEGFIKPGSYQITNNVTDSSNDLDIGAGVARDSTDTQFIDQTGTLIKQLDAPWVEGTNQGGLDTGSKAVSTTYHIYTTGDEARTKADIFWSVSATAPTMTLLNAAGYTLFRRIGSCITDASGNIIQTNWHRENNKLIAEFKDIQIPINGVSIATSPTLYSMIAPSGIESYVSGLLTSGIDTTTAGSNLTVAMQSYDQTTQTLLATDSYFYSAWRGSAGSLQEGGAFSAGITYLCGLKCNTSSELYMSRVGTYESAANYTTFQQRSYHELI